ncbi:MAG: amidohydrolase family protein [Clostridia bacterium]|nr:amidohydrolase family protein [Clostridia bacterium]
MALFEVTDYDKKIWEEELKDFLPEKIIDIHAHVHLKENFDPLPQGVKAPPKKWTALVAEDNSIEDLQETYRLMFPGKDVKALMFMNAKGLKKNNEYVAKVSKETGWPALYYSHPQQSADEVEAEIRKGGFLGVKSYFVLSPKYIPAKEARIFDFFPKHQLKRLNEMGAICMCHIPRDGRLKDPVNLAQIMEIRKEFPKLRFIVAHIGRAYVKDDIGNAFDILTQEPETMYDFSANCSEYVIEEAIRRVGAKHLMFGTDMPILRMRSHRIGENGTYVNLVPPGLYPDPYGDPHLREVSEEEGKKITFFAYEELLALKKACQNLGLTKQDVEDMMYNNAYNLIEGAKKDIYGK